MNETDIEIKLAFQEKNIKELNAAIYEQQRRLDALEKTLKLVKDRVISLADPASREEVPDEKPPHY